MRRALAIAVVVAAALSGCGADVPGAGGAGGSTLHATWRDPSGSRVLEREPGEPPVERTVLAPRARVGAELARFGLLTDAHVREEESPARATFLDRLGGAFTPTFRPQGTLTTQMLAGALRALRAQGARAGCRGRTWRCRATRRAACSHAPRSSTACARRAASAGGPGRPGPPRRARHRGGQSARHADRRRAGLAARAA